MTVIAMKDYQSDQLAQMDLDQLARLANEKHQDATHATQIALERWAEVGEALIAAKVKVKHGEWGQWINDNLVFNRPQASRYMKIARHSDVLLANVALKQHLTIEQAVAMITAAASDDADSEEPPTASATSPEPPEPPKPAKRAKAPRQPKTPPDRSGTKTGAAINALKSAGTSGLGKMETAKAADLHSPAGLSRQVESGEIVAKDGRYYHPDFASTAPLPELSLTAQQKLDAHIKRFEAQFDERVRQESMKWVNETRIPIYEKKIAGLVRMFNWPHNAIMTKQEYTAIMKCLHPDALHSRTEEQLAEAFRIFTRYKPKLMRDDDPPKTLRQSHDLPLTREEMMSRLSPAQKKKWGIV